MTAWVVGILLVWPAAVFFLSGGMGGALDRDIDRMWETRPFRNSMVVSTPAAMNAARRVFKDARALRGMTMEQARTWLKTDRRNAAFKLGKPRYDFEKDETVLVLSDGRDSIRLVAVFNDAGQITHSWPGRIHDPDGQGFGEKLNAGDKGLNRTFELWCLALAEPLRISATACVFAEASGSACLH